ncbi:MAG: 30S ribosomal protein S20 [Anaerolineales bacterium]
MANIKSQIKRNRQNDKRRLRNRVYRGAARTAVKNARAAVVSGDPENSKKALLEAISQLDRAAQKGVLHKNNAARRKSRLMKQFAKLGTFPVKTEVAAPVMAEPEAAAKPKKEPSRRRTTKKEPEVETTPEVEAKPKAEPKTKGETKKTASRARTAKKTD